MTRYSYSYFIILGLVFLCSACDSYRSTAEPKVSSPCLLEHINTGCVQESETYRLGLDDAYIRGYSYNGDTLALDIHFEANCCPAFVEKVDFLNKGISIEVGDTLYNCRCICPYNNTFRFLWCESGEIEIIFKSTGWRRSTPICSFDTLIVLSH